MKQNERERKKNIHSSSTVSACGCTCRVHQFHTVLDINAQQTQTIWIYATTRILPLDEYSLQKKKVSSSKQKFGSLHREERMHNKKIPNNSTTKGFEPIFKNIETHFIRRKFQDCCKESQDFVNEVLKEYCQNLEEMKCWRFFFCQECCLLQSVGFEILCFFLFSEMKNLLQLAGKESLQVGLGFCLLGLVVVITAFPPKSQESAPVRCCW